MLYAVSVTNLKEKNNKPQANKYAPLKMSHIKLCRESKI